MQDDLHITSIRAPVFFLFLHLPESQSFVTDSESRNMSPSRIYEPHDAVATTAYWSERSDGSRPTTNEESLIIMRQGKEVDAREMKIHDIRNTDNNFTLDTNGFQVWNLPSFQSTQKTTRKSRRNSYRQ